MNYDTNEESLKKLLEVFEKRIDLKRSFPEVEFGNYQALINWAADVCNKKWEDISYQSLKKFLNWYTKNQNPVSISERIKNIKQLEVLLEIYHKRNDLMSEIHEADFASLINWAASVSSGRWKDEDFQKLRKFKEWYLEHEFDERNSEIDLSISDIIHLSDNSNTNVLEIFKKKTDIHEHLVTLYLLVIEHSLKNTLELGVRNGESTIVLAEAASKINGHLWSVDLSDCITAKKNIKKNNLNNSWTFIKGNSIEIGKSWEEKLDHVFIDTSHIFEDTLMELTMFEKNLRKNGFFTLHDSISYPDVLNAIKEFLKNSKHSYRFYNYYNCNGLAILRKLN